MRKVVPSSDWNKREVKMNSRICLPCVESSSTMVEMENPSTEVTPRTVLTLKLRGTRKPAIRWDENTINNENMGKKSSKSKKIILSKWKCVPSILLHSQPLSMSFPNLYRILLQGAAFITEKKCSPRVIRMRATQILRSRKRVQKNLVTSKHIRGITLKRLKYMGSTSTFVGNLDMKLLTQYRCQYYLSSRDTFAHYQHQQNGRPFVCKFLAYSDIIIVIVFCPLNTMNDAS